MSKQEFGLSDMASHIGGRCEQKCRLMCLSLSRVFGNPPCSVMPILWNRGFLAIATLCNSFNGLHSICFNNKKERREKIYIKKTIANNRKVLLDCFGFICVCVWGGVYVYTCVFLAMDHYRKIWEISLWNRLEIRKYNLCIDDYSMLSKYWNSVFVFNFRGEGLFFASCN